MLTLLTLAKIAVYVLMVFSVIAAIGVVTLRNLFHAALSLVAVLFGVAGIYLVLRAEFLAMVQILLYVGAVMTLVIFAIMLTERLGDKTIRQTNRQSLPAIAVLLVFSGFLFGIIKQTPWPIRGETLARPAGILDLATALLGPYVFPFEVISVVLIAALIGAIIVAKRDRET